MKTAQSGDKVKIHLTGQIENGGRFAVTNKDAPIEFEIGQSDIMQGIQETVIGMAPNEQKVARIPSEKAFGPYQQERVQQVNRELLPPDVQFEIGKTVKVSLSSGKTRDAKVLEVCDTAVTLDLNHPLAGKDLIFNISLLEIL